MKNRPYTAHAGSWRFTRNVILGSKKAKPPPIENKTVKIPKILANLPTFALNSAAIQMMKTMGQIVYPMNWVSGITESREYYAPRIAVRTVGSVAAA